MQFANKFCEHCYRFPSGNWDNWLDTTDTAAGLYSADGPICRDVPANIKVIKCYILYRKSWKQLLSQFDNKTRITSLYLWLL